MSEEHKITTTDTVGQVDPQNLHIVVEQMRAQQNLTVGVLAGVAATIIGAAIWAGVTVASGYQIGWMAVGVGCLVGFAIRFGGKGVDPIYGYIGAGLSLLGCLAGNLLAMCGILAQGEPDVGMMDILVNLDPATASELMMVTFDPMDLLFYGLAIYEGYRFSFRQLSDEELGAIVTADPPGPPVA